jgi:hypothetical protein
MIIFSNFLFFMRQQVPRTFVENKYIQSEAGQVRSVFIIWYICLLHFSLESLGSHSVSALKAAARDWLLPGHERNRGYCSDGDAQGSRGFCYITFLGK